MLSIWILCIHILSTCPPHGPVIIRIYHECEGGIEKSVPRITNWHHEACRVMTNGDREGLIFLSHPHTNNGFFFLLTAKYLILYWKNMKKASRKSWIRWHATWWRHFIIAMTSRNDVWLFVFYLSLGLVRVCEIWYARMFFLAHPIRISDIYPGKKNLMLMWHHHVKLHLSAFRDFLKLVLKYRKKQWWVRKRYDY